MSEVQTSSTSESWAQFKTGAYRQKSAIWALVFKEFRLKLGQSRIGLFWALVEPIFSMMTIASIWHVNGVHTMQGTDVYLFIGSGFIVFITVRQGISYIPQAIDANKALMNYPQVKPIDTLLARFIQGMWFHALASVLMLVGLWWFIDAVPTFPDPLLSLTAIFVAMLLAMGISLPLAVFGTINNNVLKFIGIVSQPLMILSGVMFSIADLPATARSILQWNPIVHLVAAFRHGSFGSKLFPEYNLLYPIMFGAICLGFGYALYYIYRFRLIQQ
ncbi:ABC transporter permease [Cohaesibacter intestini]|uniref:ABC transporter permease n=1 Tax=Cohaesibacter intestini TaxID=2211145 RepID=UPI000DEA751C|nr:ABC transporter permease [Cohaesibacter intestini]